MCCVNVYSIQKSFPGFPAIQKITKYSEKKRGIKVENDSPMIPRRFPADSPPPFTGRNPACFLVGIPCRGAVQDPERRPAAGDAAALDPERQELTGSRSCTRGLTNQSDSAIMRVAKRQLCHANHAKSSSGMGVPGERFFVYKGAPFWYGRTFRGLLGFVGLTSCQTTCRCNG